MRLLKILMLAEGNNANTTNWVNNLKKYGPAEVEVYSLPRFASWKRLLYIPLAVYHVCQRVRIFKPHIIIGYRTTSYGFVGALTGFKPLVLAAQGESDVWPPGHWSNAISRMMARYAIKRAALIHAWGNNMVDSLKANGAKNDQLMVMPRGIDLMQFVYQSPFKSDRDITLITTRSLYPEYHHDVIIKSFSMVVREFTEVSWKLIIIGDGPLRSSLQEMVTASGIARHVVFKGRLEPKLLGDFLTESDVYISLPDTEGVSSSLLEAMASGCYPIVTDLPANRDMISDRKNGRLVALDVHQVKLAIIDMLKNKDEKKAVCAANRRMVESIASAEINAAKFISRYKELVHF